MIYDAHFHLDLIDNMENFINEIEGSNIKVFAVGTTPKAYSKVKELCRDCKNICIGLGMHPQLIGSGYDDLQSLKKHIAECSYIGEVGLDFSHECKRTNEAQTKTFDEIIELCECYGDKVLSIHTRKSVSKVLDIISKHKFRSGNIYILHWFTGSLTQLNRAIELGCYFSINPKMTKTKMGTEIIRNIPINRILVETDSPFACTSKTTHELEETLKKTITDISQIIDRDITEIVFQNSKNVFNF